MTDKRKLELYDALLNHIIELCSQNDLPHTLAAIGFTTEEIHEVTTELFY